MIKFFYDIMRKISCFHFFLVHKRVSCCLLSFSFDMFQVSIFKWDPQLQVPPWWPTSASCVEPTFPREASHPLLPHPADPSQPAPPPLSPPSITTPPEVGHAQIVWLFLDKKRKQVSEFLRGYLDRHIKLPAMSSQNQPTCSCTCYWLDF